MVRVSSMSRFRRPLAAAVVLALHAALIALFLRPILLPSLPPVDAMVVVDVPAPQPPPSQAPPEPPPQPSLAPKKPAPTPAPAAQPAPPAAPAPVASPAPAVDIRTDVAPTASTGTEAQSGAAVDGDGTGATGPGTGTGGDGGNPAAKPRWRSGRIETRDWPAAALAANAGGTVVVHFDVSRRGRASNCIVFRSSGNDSLDRTTCEIIERRFRFHPARDAAGKPVESVAGWQQRWWLKPAV
jgi:protein TonB